MDRNNSIGYLLMAVLFVGWMFYSNNKAKELRAEEEAQMAEQAIQDSLDQLLVDKNTETLTIDSLSDDSNEAVNTTTSSDSTQIATPSIAKETYVLENDKLKLTFSNLGGRIIQADLLEYDSYESHFEEHVGGFIPVTLYTEETSKFNWETNGIDSEKTMFDVEKTGNSLKFTSDKGIIQAYSFNPDNPYLIDYKVSLPDDEATLEWDTHFKLQERDMRSDREFSFSAYKTSKGKLKKFKKLKESVSETVDEPLDFIVERQRFFNQTLLSDGAFNNTKLMSSYDKEDKTEFTKLLQAETQVNLDNGQRDFQILISPNDRDILASVDKKLESIQPAGIFGLTKALAWFFNKLRPLSISYGLLILLMTLLIKLILTPLTYRSYLSQAKMSVLKPELAELKEKFGGDQAKMSQAQMKLYSTAGVNPLGGCVPSVLQIPIFFSLYYFFRSSIYFRQKEFLWAKDLSTYDAFIDLPFELPLLGSHISLFAILYGVALFFSMRLNSSMLTGGVPSTGGGKDGNDMQSMMQTQVKIMQYGMPLFLPIIFNSFPAALTFYYFCYNVINALQTLIIKKVVIDEDKIHQKIQENKAKPKKQGGIRKRIEDAMKAQQELQEKRSNK